MADIIIKGNQNTTRMINELKRSSVQYDILDKDQERKLIEENKSNRERLNHLLFMHNIRMVFKLATKYMSKTDDYDSLVQNGMLGLAEAVKRFDPARNIKFCTFAMPWVHKYLSSQYYTAQFKLDMKTVSMNMPSMTSEQGSSVSADDTFENCINSVIDPTVNIESSLVENRISALEQSKICDDLYNWVNSDSSLSATDREIFREIFVEQDKTRDIAERHNIDITDVSEIKRRILNKCKDRLEQRYSIKSYSDIG